MRRRLAGILAPVTKVKMSPGMLNMKLSKPSRLAATGVCSTNGGFACDHTETRMTTSDGQGAPFARNWRMGSSYSPSDIVSIIRPVSGSCH